MLRQSESPGPTSGRDPGHDKVILGANLLQAGTNVAADFPDMGQKPFLLGGEDLQNRQAGIAGQAPTGKGRGMLEAEFLAVQLPAGQHRPHGDEAAAQGLGQEQAIGVYPFGLTGEELAGDQPVWISSTTRGTLGAELARPGKIARRRHYHAALALNGLHQKGGGVLGMGPQKFFQGRKITEGNFGKARGRGAETRLVVGVAGGGQGPQGLAVKALAGGEDELAPGGCPAQLNGGLHRFGAAIGKGYVLQTRRGQLDEAPGQGGRRLQG